MRGTVLIALLAAAVLVSQPAARIEGIALCTPQAPTEHVVVFLQGDRTRGLERPRKPVVLDQRNLRFQPHVLPIMRGTTVVFPNSDRIRHNVFSASEARMFNLGTYHYGVNRRVTFDKPGVVELLCNVHLEMSAYIIVLDTPYFSSTDRRGFFRITGLDRGKYRLGFWCEHRGFLSRQLVLEPGRTTILRAVLHENRVELKK